MQTPTPRLAIQHALRPYLSRTSDEREKQTERPVRDENFALKEKEMVHERCAYARPLSPRLHPPLLLTPLMPGWYIPRRQLRGI